MLIADLPIPRLERLGFALGGAAVVAALIAAFERSWALGVAALLLSAGSLAAYLRAREVSGRVPLQQKPALGIFANLDGIYNGEVSGWAFDADHPDQPLTVTVFVNQQPVAQVAAVHYRSDVAAALNCSGRYGFYVDLAEYFREDGEALIDARLPNHWPLEGAPRILHSAAIPPREHKPTVLFMHIPKTAGTAFREAIAANFLPHEIAYLYPGPPGFLVPDLRALPLEQRRTFRVVIGHYQFGMHWALPQPSEYITIVREPVARVLSQYRFLRQAQPHLFAPGQGKLRTFEDLLEKHLTTDFDNTLVRCFSGVDERDYPPGKLTQEIYNQAVHNLRSSFCFVGHQEESSQAYQWLREHYHWHAAHTLSSVNRGEISLDQDASLIDIARRFNTWDLLFYQEIQRVFPRPPAQRESAVTAPR